MKSLTLECPAKVNLMLSVHGVRPDGFHALNSIVAPLEFCDTLTVGHAAERADRLKCDDPAVPVSADNLILRAAALFRDISGQAVYFDFDLKKRIPMGAGLGGGSSDAAVALKAMNVLAGEPLSHKGLLDAAATLGSDCPFFIDGAMVRMSGRGEQLEALPASIQKRLSGQRIVLFRPDFGVPTAWAYGQLRARGAAAYESERAAKERIERFAARAKGDFRELLFNSFEAVVGKKYLAIACLLERLRAQGFASLMSGSGSCCFALIGDAAEVERLRGFCVDAFGEGSFFVESRLREVRK